MPETHGVEPSKPPPTRGQMSGEAMIEMPGTSYRGELPPADEALLSLAAELRQDVARLAVDIGERNLQKPPGAIGPSR